MTKDEAWKAHVDAVEKLHMRCCFEAGWEAALADTLGLQTALSQMLYWATCYSLDCKHSKFMSTHRKTLMEREIAEAEALLKGDADDEGRLRKSVGDRPAF